MGQAATAAATAAAAAAAMDGRQWQRIGNVVGGWAVGGLFSNGFSNRDDLATLVGSVKAN